MPTLASHYECTGCSACVAACPVGAIAMEDDFEGFTFPRVNLDACVSCGLCTKICPVVTEHVSNNNEVLGAYGCTLKDVADLKNSTSGGLFYAIARSFVDDGGVVYGAALDEDLRVRHHAARTDGQLQKLRKSKYVQSDIGDVFHEIKDNLSSGQQVLFCGTPCQCAGLKAYLRTRYDNLYSIKLFCGQITGNLTWRSYLDEIEQTRGSKVVGAGFREKRSLTDDSSQALGVKAGGWRDPYIRIDFEQGERLFSRWTQDKWAVAYIHNLLPRSSCLSCRFKEGSACTDADLAIGDFWGVENNAAEAYLPAGVSAAIVHSRRGEELMKRALQVMNVSPVSVEAIREGNPFVWDSVSEHPRRVEFLSAVAEKSRPFSSLVNTALGVSSDVPDGLTFGVWGGFNLRAAVLYACGVLGGSMEYHISNTTFISQATNSVELSDDVRLPSNGLRAAMLKIDAAKNVFDGELGKRVGDVDYIVVDLIEERHGLATLENGGILSYSDAFRDSSLVAHEVLGSWEIDFEEWKTSCSRFIDNLLKLLDRRRIILVESYFSQYFEGDDGSLRPFTTDELGISVEAANGWLARCYDFFVDRCSPGCVIRIPEGLWFCQGHHKHGVMPSHSNTKSNDRIAAELCRVVQEERA